MGIGQGDLHREIALRRAGVGESLVVRPGKFCGDGHVAAVADAGHRGQELLQARRIGIESFEHRGGAAADFVLRQAGPKGFGEVAPEAVEAWLAISKMPPMYEGLCLSRKVSVAGVLEYYPSDLSRNPRATRASRKSRDARGCRPIRPWMLSSDCGPLARSVKSSISTALNRNLRGPESHAHLHDQFRGRLLVQDGFPSCDRVRRVLASAAEYSSLSRFLRWYLDSSGLFGRTYLHWFPIRGLPVTTGTRIEVVPPHKSDLGGAIVYT